MANALGVVPGLDFSDTVLPECSGEDVPDDLVYSMDGLPEWLVFDATTRTLSLAEGVTEVPDDVLDPIEVTYTCTSAADPDLTASATFTLNDVDGGGVVDGLEYVNCEPPLVNSDSGWIALDCATADLYRTPAASPRKIPTAVVIAEEGMSAADPDDDAADFDGDGLTNAEELAAGTNIFVATREFTGFDRTDLGDQGDLNIPYATTLADLDGDGDLDLAVANSSAGDNLDVWLGDGAGSFALNESHAVDGCPQDVVAADLDGDENQDLVVVGNCDPNIHLLMGNGDGSFDDPVAVSLGCCAAADAVTVVDLDGDGDLDLAAVDGPNATIDVLLGEGDGTFGDPTPYVLGGVSQEDLVAADMDEDGDLDLVTHGGNTIGALVGPGNGSFVAVINTPFATSNPASLSLADFDGDGHLDLLIPSEGDDTVKIAFGNGDGTFEAAAAAYFVDDGPEDAIPADLNGDGAVDFVSLAFDGNSLSVFINGGDGTFAPSGDQVDTDNGPRGGSAGDLDGDGDIDLVLVNQFDNTFSVFLNSDD